ncbi:serine protease [Gracilibacillus halophilus YIM-C55.5]|uniref:Serine protease n=1 Tax=Gracilibacillus halophilus YIM-C55.5 TaxID=1308866 RepID=N4WN71_9BACI|nr:trypsin-like peptidase domain-containing protein [Gracilibacillus halophilus]ENH95950.1 serine protease [Gracilibacillus halophilus YIM-C55.5]
MGYYDHHYPNRRKRKRSWLTPFIIGAVLGAFLFAVLLPTMVTYDLLPYQVITGEMDDANEADNDQSNPGTTSNVTNVEVDISTRISDIVSEVTPAVVGVVNVQSGMSLWDQEEENQQGIGSGVIYKIDNSSAYIITNHHVIQGADQVEIMLPDESRVEASIVGSDMFTDLAVIEIDASYAEQAIEIGTSSQVNVGEPAIAIGNPLGMNLSGSVTQGIISGTQRAIPQDFNGDGRADWQAEVIQTDAAINPGNSGGALINMEGQLIGINSMKIAQSAVEGIGFAIPVDDAIPVIQELEQNGEVTRAYLGVEAYSLEDVAQAEWDRSLELPAEVEGGIYIRSVEPMSPAEQGGLEAYDVITALDGEPIYNIVDLRKHLYQEKSVGETLEITYYRRGEQQQTTVELGTLSY